MKEHVHNCTLACLCTFRQIPDMCMKIHLRYLIGKEGFQLFLSSKRILLFYGLCYHTVKHQKLETNFLYK